MKLLLTTLLSISITFNTFFFTENKFIRKMNNELKQEKYEQLLNIASLDGQITQCHNLSFQYNRFLGALEKVGSIPYNANYSNCYDHTKLMQTALADNDIESSILINENRTHAWLAVWIEATNGHFISTSSPYSIMEVRNGNLEVICNK